MMQATEQEMPAVKDRFCRDLLGERYFIWHPEAAGMRSNRSILSHAPVLSDSAAAAVLSLTRDVAALGQPQLRRISEDHFAWGVPILSDPLHRVAIEIVGTQPDELARLVNRSSLSAWTNELSAHRAGQQMKSQDDQLMAYAAQVSEDLEELTWLRNLATNLELSESGNSVDRITETVLPSLCRRINARSLVFVRDIRVTGMDVNLPIIWQTGQIEIPRKSCLEIIEGLLETGGDRTVVRNYDERMFAGESFEGSKSYLLVPVATASARLGWLLAVNKDTASNDSSSQHGDSTCKTWMSHSEFGSFEASLMSATAVVLAAHGRNCGLFHEKELLLRGVIRSLINAIDAKDSYTCGHSDRVAEFARLIAREMSLEFSHCEQIYMTGLLHDVGKIGVPDDVLNKPGQLTAPEFELIKQHPVIGYEILKHLDNLSYVLPGVLHHHEALDGTGYPHGLKGDDIPLPARILAVADSYDAITSDRPYRRGMPTEKAEAILKDGSGRQWDPVCVDAFFRTLSGVRLFASQKSSPLSAPCDSAEAAESGSQVDMQTVQRPKFLVISGLCEEAPASRQR